MNVVGSYRYKSFIRQISMNWSFKWIQNSPPHQGRGFGCPSEGLFYSEAVLFKSGDKHSPGQSAKAVIQAKVIAAHAAVVELELFDSGSWILRAIT